MNSFYHYWAYGIGHLLEVFVENPAQSEIDKFRCKPIELGLVYEPEAANVILFAYRRPDFISWGLTQYCWHRSTPSLRALPPLNVLEGKECRFRVSFVEMRKGRNIVVRESELPLTFAKEFHAAINEQSQRPAMSSEEYRQAVERMPQLLINKTIEQKLNARCQIE